MKPKHLHTLLILALTLLLTNCNIWPFVLEQEQEEPQIPNLEEFYISLEKFIAYSDSLDNDMFYNWGGAVEPALYWSELLNNYDSLFSAYQLCTFNEPEHFGGNTWYWTVNLPTFTFEIFATPSLSSCYYEGYLISKDDNNRYKVFEGNYSEENSEGTFAFYTEDDTLNISWEEQSGMKLYQLRNTESGTYERLYFIQSSDLTQYYEITTNNEEDTAFIYLHQDLSGEVKNHNYFGDYYWHCWDYNLRNSECINIIEF